MIRQRSRGLQTLFRLFLNAVCMLAIWAPAFAQVPTPAEIIGFAPGEDYKLAHYGPIAAYYEALAASTDRMVLKQIGESTRGEPLYIAAISTPENLARVERYKEIARTLAYARDPDEPELSTAVEHIGKIPPYERQQAYEDIVWALINTKEFIFNH